MAQEDKGIEAEAWKVYDARSIDHIPHLQSLDPRIVEDIKLAAYVFPFRANRYALDNLVDWQSGTDDPMFRLLFPMPDMLAEEDRAELRRLLSSGASVHEIARVVRRIRDSLNPDPSEQSANSPLIDGVPLEGIQHKYPETVLAFPAQGQTCHSYCSFCFRWPQFVSDSPVKYELKDPRVLHGYLRQAPQVTDLLLTGGDPMVMATRRLASYLEPLTAPDLAHVRTIRLGTKALSYWPHRFFSNDGSELIALLKRLVESGKHIALMAHVNHWRELLPDMTQRAIARLREIGVVIRTQSPVLRGINDDPGVWARKWREQTNLGLVPYYMFVERDTGAHRHFRIPLARALEIYQAAVSSVSGISRTARGPVMSAGPGKVQLLGTVEVGGRRCFALTFLQARRNTWLNQIFFADFSESAHWLDQLVPTGGADRFFFAEEYERFLSDRKQMPFDMLHSESPAASERRLVTLA